MDTVEELELKIKKCGDDYFLMYGYVRQLEYLKMRKESDAILQKPFPKAAEKKTDNAANSND